MQTSGTLTYAFGFTGREHDGDTGLIYSRQRYYDPSVGSWLSPDRKKMINGPNLYQYALDNPATWTDASGTFIPLIAWIVAVVGLLLISNDEDAGPGVAVVLLGGGIGAGAAVCTAAEVSPSVPAGLTNSQFGALIGWGTGNIAALSLISEISPEQVEEWVEAGVTPEMAEEWQAFYEDVVANDVNALNPSAAVGCSRVVRVASWNVGVLAV